MSKVLGEKATLQANLADVTGRADTLASRLDSVTRELQDTTRCGSDLLIELFLVGFCVGACVVVVVTCVLHN